MSNKRILHFIDALGKGGAEMLLAGVVRSMPEYEHVIVTLYPLNEFNDEIPDSVEIICLHAYSQLQKVRSVFKLRRILREKQIDVIHSHLYWPTMIARLSKTSKQKLISSYHNVLYGRHGSSYGTRYKLIDKFTYRSSHLTLSVSEQVKADLAAHIGIVKNSEVLYNYVDNKYYKDPKAAFEPGETLRILSVGNLKPQKNYVPVIQAMAEETPVGFTWDIYGEGPERTTIETLINEHQLHQINLKGSVKNVNQIIRQYDLLLFPSKWEGFGIALVEAMAAGLPCLVADLPVLREVAEDTVMYFDPEKPHEALSAIEKILDNTINIDDLVKKSRERALAFNSDNYMQRLKEWYA